MMKKTLVALAVLGASGLVAAQSSVTLYGIADAGIGRIGKGKTQFMGGNTLVNNTPSRIGLKGTEDIGGGNIVGFAFEHGLSLNDGRSVEFDNTPGNHLFDTQKTASHFWDRDANVFVGGSWGVLKMGRQVTPSHISEFAYDLTGLANYSAMRGTYAAVGIGAWADSAIAYITPNLSGFQAAVAFVSKHNSGLAKNVWDLGAWYNNGGLGVGASVNKGLDNGKTNWHLGAKYAFGNFTVGGSYHNVSGDGGIAFPFADTQLRRGFGLGASAKFGACTVTLDLTRDTKNDWLGKKYTNALLEAKYALSKRTFFYADFLRLDGTNNWGLGINHSF